jgi:ferredoxin, 2Fe-2S
MIFFFVTFGEESYAIETYHGEYRNLMQLISDKIFIEGFGECKGMGRCGICMAQQRLAALLNWE